MSADTSRATLPPLPEVAGLFTFADMRVALTNYGWLCRKAALNESVDACVKVAMEANTEADPGYVSSRAGGDVACKNKIKDLL